MGSVQRDVWIATRKDTTKFVTAAPAPNSATVRAVIGKLDHLVASGITALELMPLADFAGSRNWGYDGVLWYAPDSSSSRSSSASAVALEARRIGRTVTRALRSVRCGRRPFQPWRDRSQVRERASRSTRPGRGRTKGARSPSGP